MPSPSESKGIERFLAEEAAYGLFFIGTPKVFPELNDFEDEIK